MNPQLLTASGQGRSCRRLVGGSRAWLGVSSGGLFCWLVELVEGDGVPSASSWRCRRGRGAQRSSACAASRVRDRGRGLGRGRCGSTRRAGRGGSHRSLSALRGALGAGRSARRDRCLSCGPRRGRIGELRGQPRGPGRVRPDRLRPADSWWPGHAPAQDAKCPTVGKTDISRPHSAIRTSAARAGRRGSGEQLDDLGVWREHGSIRSVRSAAPRRACRYGRAVRDHDSVMLDREPAWSASLSSGIFARICPGQLGELLGIGHAREQRLSMRARTRDVVEATLESLIPASWSTSPDAEGGSARALRGP